MWRLVKSEFKYNWYTYSLLTITLVLYTIFSLIDFNLTHDNNFNTDLWGGLYSFVFVVFILSVWGQRLKEKRNRYFALLPISVKYLAVSPQTHKTQKLNLLFISSCSPLSCLQFEPKSSLNRSFRKKLQQNTESPNSQKVQN